MMDSNNYSSLYGVTDINGSDFLVTNTLWFDFSTEEPIPIALPGSASLIEFILRLVTLIITLFGNALVLYAYATTTNLRTYTNYYIGGLAVADFFAGGVMASVILYQSYLGYWPFTEVGCTCLMFMHHVFLQATFFMTLVICYDRFRALNMPLKHLKNKTMRHACFLISLAYIIPVLIWTPIIVVFPYVGLATRIRPPLCTGPYALHPPLLIFTILVLSWIPMLVTSILYAFVYSAVIRKGVNKKRGIGEEASSNYVSENRPVSPAATDDAHGPGYGASHSQTSPDAEPGFSEDQVFSVSAGLSTGLTNLAFEQTDDDNSKSHPETTTGPFPHMSPVPPAKRPAKHRPNEPSTKPGIGTLRRKTRASILRSKRESRLASLRATRTLTYIMITMVVTALPWSIFALWAAVDIYTFPLRGRSFEIIGWLASLSSTVNPLCYAASNPLFKEAFMRILRCQRIRNTSGRSSQGGNSFSQSGR